MLLDLKTESWIHFAMADSTNDRKELDTNKNEEEEAEWMGEKESKGRGTSRWVLKAETENLVKVSAANSTPMEGQLGARAETEILYPPLIIVFVGIRGPNRGTQAKLICPVDTWREHNSVAR